MNIFFGAVIGSVMFAVSAFSQVTIKEAGGWLENAYVKWAPVSGATSYNVYYTGGGATNKKIDSELIRGYGSFFRADVLGISAGSYTLKIVPVIGSTENTSLATTTQSLTVKAHVREGFAFTGDKAIGGYNGDGTVKTDARILYINSSNANTITCAVKNKDGVAVTATGLINILTALKEGYDKGPVVFRLIGLVRASHLTGTPGNIYIEGKSGTQRIENITFEGVGDDATAYGYGFLVKRSRSIEIRNVGIMLFTDDGVSIDTDNDIMWVHNVDFFYGAPGSDADQVKGDGSIDIKYNSTHITLSYNHFWDSGKVMGIGGASGETVGTLLVSIHHNWFDHADSRCARLTSCNAHIYNNYYDGVAKYSVGGATSTKGSFPVSSSFVESNHFRGLPRPMTISEQGTDTYNPATGAYTLEGTFSGQGGGIIKAFNNKMDNCTGYVPQTTNATQFDAYEVTSRSEKIPSTVKTVSGSNTYNNFDTDAAMYACSPDAVNDVSSIVTTYAGRVNGGNFKWTFNNAVDDPSYEINTELKAAIVAYNGQTDIQFPSEMSQKGYQAALPTILLNPVTNSLKVSAMCAVSKIEIYSITDALVKAAGSTNAIDMHNFSNGSYMVVVSTEKAKFQNLIVKK